MSDYPWLKPAIENWKKIVQTDKIPHALLLSGTKGIGKSKAAQQMAHVVLCEQLTDSGACLTCKACQLFKAGNHTDLTEISAEKSVIKVDQIRKLSKDVTLTSSRNHNRVIIIHQAEQMNKASSNALLKTLEEPPANVVIILTTSEIGYLLATIKSRCFKINMPMPPPLQSQQWLQSVTNNSKDETLKALLLCNNSPISAFLALENNSISVTINFLDDLKQLSLNQKTVLSISKEWSAMDESSHFSQLAAYFLAVIKSNCGLSNQQIPELAGFAQLLQQIEDANDKLLKFVNKMHQFQKRNETALKTDLLIEELLVNWHENFIIKQQ